MRVVLLTLAVLCGCGHLYQKHTMVFADTQVATTNELICYSLDNHQLLWGAFGVAFGAFSGSAATVMSVIDNKPVQYSLAGGSVLFTGLAAVAAYLQNSYVKKYSAAHCGGNL